MHSDQHSNNGKLKQIIASLLRIEYVVFYQIMNKHCEAKKLHFILQ